MINYVNEGYEIINECYLLDKQSIQCQLSQRHLINKYLEIKMSIIQPQTKYVEDYIDIIKDFGNNQDRKC